jgi:thiamine biosynthesis lipoprotein
MSSRLGSIRLVFALLTSLFFFIACKKPSGDFQTYRETRLLMGTAVQIQAVGRPQTKDAIRKAFDEINRIEKKMGVRNPQSDIARINNMAGSDAIPLDREMFDFLGRSLDLCYKTEGAFNIAIGPLSRLWNFDIGPLSRLWNFDGGGEIVPEANSIQERLANLDFKKIILDRINHTISLSSQGMALDLGGIAKGYAVDRAVEILKSSGVSSGIINAGGDMRLFGKKPQNQLWHIGVQHPRKNDGVLITFKVTDRAVVSSGDYERFFIKEGVRYHHILDSVTGYPASECMSVTVVAETAFLADAMATAIFVQGKVKGFKLLQDQKDLEGIIVASDGKTFITPGLEKIIEWKEDN